MSKYSLIIGWVLTAIAIILIALIIVPQHNRSDSYWLKVFWTEILCLISWGSIFFYSFLFSKDDASSRYGGIAPTISIIVMTYSILSFLTMIVNSYISVDFVNRIHLVLQIVLFVGAAISILFLSISRETAVSGQTFNRLKAITPKELKDILSFCESSIRNPNFAELKSNIKQLKETVQFSLNENASLSNMPQYQEFCIEIKNFSDSVSNLMRDKNGDNDQVNFLIETAKKITANTKLIADKLIRR